MNGVIVTGTIIPTSEVDEFAVTDEKYHKGGYRSVESSTERYAITLARRSEGMLVKELSSGLYYTLHGGVTDDCWQIENMSDGSPVMGVLVLLNGDLW